MTSIDIVCDGCFKPRDEVSGGWVSASYRTPTGLGAGYDYCKECWARMLASLARPEPFLSLAVLSVNEAQTIVTSDYWPEKTDGFDIDLVTCGGPLEAGDVIEVYREPKGEIK